MIRKIGRAARYNLAPTTIKPKSFTAVLTGRCNLRCQTCNFWNSKIPEMPTEKWKDIITQFAEMGFDHASFTGGEPLLRDDLFELAGFTRNLGITIGLQTNAALIGNYMDKLNDFESVTISLDSLKVHDKIRGVEGTLDKVLENIKVLAGKGIKVGIRTVVQADNYEELEDIVGYCERSGIDNLEFLYVRNASNQYVSPQNQAVYEMNEKRLKEILKKVCSRKIVNNDYSYFDLCIKRNKGPVEYPCLRPYEGVIVHPDGRVFPCCGELPSVGDLNEKSLKEIWNDKRYSIMRKKAFKCEINPCKICTSPNIQRVYNIGNTFRKRVLKSN